MKSQSGWWIVVCGSISSFCIPLMCISAQFDTGDTFTIAMFVFQFFATAGLLEITRHLRGKQ